MKVVSRRIGHVFRTIRAVVASVINGVPRRVIDVILVVAALGLISTAAIHLWSEDTFVLVGAGVVLAALAFWKIPQWQAEAAVRRNTKRDRFETENTARVTLAQALGGLFLVIGLAVTWSQLDAMRDELQLNREQQQTAAAQASTGQANVREGQDAASTQAAADRELARQGQLTERFSTAVGQLGDDKLQIRLGGIYALEQIAEDSREYVSTVHEVLTAFVRQHAPWPSVGVATPRPDALGKVHPDADVQAVLTVIERGHWSNQIPRQQGERQRPATPSSVNPRPPSWLSVGLRCLDLSGTDLRGAQFRGSDLIRMCFIDANLSDADLADAHLQSADFSGAFLVSTLLPRANLKGAKLYAHLESANLIGAHLESAFLTNADLTRARLSRAYLSDADMKQTILNWTKLDGADLSTAKNLTQEQINAAYTDESTVLPPGIVRPASSPIPQATQETIA